MRRLLTFTCEGAALGGTLDDADGATGVLIVTGGTQTRIGSHRLFERLSGALANAGHPAFRFDRRGVGDSEGADPGYTGNAADIAAALAAFRAECPSLRRVIGFGLCDGATSLALFGAGLGLDGFLLANPWFVEAGEDAPAPAAIRDHYQRRLLSLEGWRKLLGGGVSYRKLFAGVLKITGPAPPADLAGQVAGALGEASVPVELILSRRDNTAIAAKDAWDSPVFGRVRTGARISAIDSDSHTFARPGDFAALLTMCLEALGRMGG